MSESLANQIMDELMDRPMSFGELSRTLGALFETVRLSVRKLEKQGLVIASHARTRPAGPPEIVWAMARTKSVEVCE